MADLGAVTLRPSFPPPRADYQLIGQYNIIRGRFLGVVTLRADETVRATYESDLSTYIVRQIGVVYRQLWPTHGQRFPQ